MKFDPRVHHRRSIRLQGYDYSQSGAYFVTICTQDRALLIANHPVSEVIRFAWEGLPDRFEHTLLDEFVVMPNHVHGIIIFTEPDAAAGEGRPALAGVVGAFKSISAIAANRLLSKSGTPFWQRNYYEHVIRSEEKLNQIRQYICDNPAKWADDPNNPENIRQRTSSAKSGSVQRGNAGAGQAHAPTR